MEHTKLQIGCLTILCYIAYIYFKQCRLYRQSLEKSRFGAILILGMVEVCLDGVTAYTVNHLDTVPDAVNRILHGLFLASLDSVIFALCIYMLIITGAYPTRKIYKILIFAPYIINIILVLINIASLQYIQGKVTNYSMGASAYTCFVMAAIYNVIMFVIFFGRWRFIERHKRASIFTYLLVLTTGTVIQMIFPETLISSIAVTVFVLGVYMNLEDPAIRQLSRHHRETVMGFANLIENRDGNTGGHIKRTSLYVELIAKELRVRGMYNHELTKDYIENLIKAAPMHDIGKISVPDAILQKPGKLTDEEFETMKLHAPNGAKIIKKTFKNLGNEDYRKMAYEVARYHHEKWNGRGYPDGLKGEDIPLCARIMAVADVFDAVSEKRCYRDAMPIDKCFDIIRQGIGTDFDPVIAGLFLDIRENVEEIHRSVNKEIIIS